MAMILSRNGLCMRRFALEMFLSYLESSSCLPWAIGNYLNRPSLTTAFRFRSPCCSRSDYDSPECSWRADPRMRINCVGRRIERHRPDFGRSPVGRCSPASYRALDGLKNITHEEACTLPPEWKEQNIEPQISRCAIWWEQVGKFRDWSRN